MDRFIFYVDSLTAWVGKAFAWTILLLSIGVAYEVFVRYALRDPTSWAFDLSYMMYGTLFMMAGAYALSRDTHVRGDVLYPQSESSLLPGPPEKPPQKRCWRSCSKAKGKL